MVGVAGKSKGCATCRKRKIKCDLTPPACQRCQRSGRECEGYERFPVFIVKTANGTRKRQPLEEVKVKVRRGAALPAAAVAQVSDASAAPMTLAFSIPNTFTQVAYQTWLYGALVSAPHVKQGLKKPLFWLRCAMDLPYPEPILIHALSAVALTYASKIYDDHDMLQCGRRLYGKILVQFRSALRTPKLVMQDDVLATAAALIFYELVDSNSPPFEGWAAHVTGLTSLLQYRGPSRHRTPLARAILEHARHLVMVRSLIMRERSPLGDELWLREPWTAAHKSNEQQIYDEGLRLAGILEEIVCIEGDSSETSRLSLILEGCVSICRNLQRLSPLPERRVGPAVPISVHSSARGCQFAPDTLLLGSVCLGIQLGALNAVYKLLERTVAGNALNFSLEVVIDLPYGSIAIQQLEAFATRQSEMARMAVVLIHDYLSNHKGNIGGARLVFTLRHAKVHLMDDSVALVECETLLQRFGGDSWQLGGLVDPG